MTDWYENRHMLEPGQVFKTYDDSIVMLDRRVAGDGTQWHVLDWSGGHWFCEDNIIEPGELVMQITDPEES